MGEAYGVHEVDGLEDLPGEALDVFDREAEEAVLLEEVVKGGSEFLEDHEIVSFLFESIETLDNMVFLFWIVVLNIY